MYLVVEVDKKELQFQGAGVSYTREEALTPCRTLALSLF